MTLEDLFPGRRTLEQERFLDTLFHHAGFWYATEVAGTEEAFVRDGFSRRKQAPRSSPLDRIAALFERRSNQPDHEHYADPGFQIVSARVLPPQYALPNSDRVDFGLSQEEIETGTRFKITPVDRYHEHPSRTILLDGGNQDPIVEFILSTARQDQAPDGSYRYSTFGLVVPANEAPIVQAFVDADPTLLDHVKREMFPVWEAQYPTVPVGAGVHVRPEPHPHRAQPRDHRVADLYARLDRVNARIADLGARLAQPIDFDAIYSAAYAGAGSSATVAVPRYERPEPRRAPEAPRPAPEPRTEPYVRAQPAPRPVLQPEVPPDLWADKTVYPPTAEEAAAAQRFGEELEKMLNSQRPAPKTPRAPEPRAPYQPPADEAQRRADYLASLRRPEPETPRAPEPEAPTQTYVAHQPSPERAQVIADAQAAARQQEEYLVARLRQRQPETPAPTPEPAPAHIPQAPAPLDDAFYVRARELVDKLGVQPSASLFRRRLDLSHDNASLLVQRFRDEAYEASRTPSAPAPPAPTVSGEYQAVTPSMFELPVVPGAPPPATSDEALERARDAKDIMSRLVSPPVPLPSRLDALADELFPEPAPAPLRDVPLSSPQPSTGVAQKVYRYTLEVDDINPDSGDFPGRTYTVIREGDRVRLEGDVLRTIEGRLLGAVDFDTFEDGSPFIQYVQDGTEQYQYKYRELVNTILANSPRPTTNFLQDLFAGGGYLELESYLREDYVREHHLFVAGMPQRPESRMGTEQLSILGRIVNVEELPPDYKGPNLGDIVGALPTYTTPQNEDRIPTLTPPPAPEISNQLLSDEELADLISACCYPARGTQAVPPPIPPIDPRAETDPSLPTPTYGASVPAPEDRSVTLPITPSMIISRVPPTPDAPKPVTLEETIEQAARPIGHGVVHDLDAVQSSPAGPGYFGGAATQDASTEYEVATQDVLSIKAVGAKVARRQAEPSVDAEALFNEGVRLIRIGNIGTGLRSLTDAYQANPIYIDRGLRFAMKQIREGSSEGISSERVNSILSILDDIIGVDPTGYALAYVGRSFIYSKQAEINDDASFLQQSLGDIDEACRLEPGNAAYKQQREEIQKQALQFIARNARIYRTDHEFREGSWSEFTAQEIRCAPIAYDDYLVIGNHLFLFNIDNIFEQETLVGSIAVKGWTRKTRKQHVQELIGPLPNELKDLATPLVEYQSFVAHCVQLATEGKSYSPEPQQGNYLIAKKRRRDPETGQDLDEAVLDNLGRVVSCKTAYDKKGREKSGQIANVEHAVSRYYENKVRRPIPFQELLSSL